MTMIELFKALSSKPEILRMEAKMGSTGYLDQTEPKDMPSEVAIGTDAHGRKFISMIVGDGVLTAFQRYSDKENLWAFAMASNPSNACYEMARKLGTHGYSAMPDAYNMADHLGVKLRSSEDMAMGIRRGNVQDMTYNDNGSDT